MTRKHFESIAANIRWQVVANLVTHGNPVDPHLHNVLRSLTSDMCATFRTINPNFNTAQFVQACGF